MAKADHYKRGWHHDPNVTSDVKFFATDHSSNLDAEFLYTNVNTKERQFYTLSFVYCVREENENVYFSYDIPYTYSKNLFTYI